MKGKEKQISLLVLSLLCIEFYTADSILKGTLKHVIGKNIPFANPEQNFTKEYRGRGRGSLSLAVSLLRF